MNWWGWGSGHQETAEFNILEAYFIARHGITQRIRSIQHPNYVHNRHDGWVLTFLDRSTLVVPT